MRIRINASWLRHIDPNKSQQHFLAFTHPLSDGMNGFLILFISKTRPCPGGERIHWRGLYTLVAAHAICRISLNLPVCRQFIHHPSPAVYVQRNHPLVCIKVTGRPHESRAEGQLDRLLVAPWCTAICLALPLLVNLWIDLLGGVRAPSSHPIFREQDGHLRWRPCSCPIKAQGWSEPLGFTGAYMHKGKNPSQNPSAASVGSASAGGTDFRLGPSYKCGARLNYASLPGSAQCTI